MKKHILMALAAVLALTARADEPSAAVQQAIGLGLPVVAVYTVDSQEPTCEPVEAPPGCIGVSITDAIKVPGRVLIYRDGEAAYDSGDYVKSESGMTIKVRGNSSANAVKKPYKIKLQKKEDLMQRGKKYKDKNWVLLNDADMRQYFGHKVAYLMEQPWTPQGEYVNLVMNDDYRGMYLLCEGVERNTDCRVNVDKTGFIVEFDPYWWNEGGAYIPSMEHPKANFTFKYPEWEDMTEDDQQRYDYLLQMFEQGLRKENYHEFVDVTSMARWLLIHNILGVSDAHGSNRYFTRYDSDPATLVHAGPAWDFDSAEQTGNTFVPAHDLYRWMIDNEKNPMLRNEMKRMWHEKSETVFATLTDWLLDLLDHAEAFDASADATAARWWQPASRHPHVRDNVTRALRWYGGRQTALDGLIEGLKTSAVETIETPEANYTLTGRHLLASGTDITLISAGGMTVATASGCLSTLLAPGIYILRTDGATSKIMVR